MHRAIAQQVLEGHPDPTALVPAWALGAVGGTAQLLQPFGHLGMCGQVSGVARVKVCGYEVRPWVTR